MGTFFGLLTGSLVGLLGGPIGVAVGASTGTMIGAAFDLTRAGIAGDFLEEVSEYLLPGKTAVIAELDEEWQAPIDTRMEALGGHVFRRNRIAVEDAYYERQIAAYREELTALEAEREKASAERKARLEARIEDTRHKLQDKRDELKARIESVKREGEAKIESLQQQLKTAQDERKQRLEKRLAEIRADYRAAIGQAPAGVGADEVRAPLSARSAGSLHGGHNAVREPCSPTVYIVKGASYGELDDDRSPAIFTRRRRGRSCSVC